MKIITLNIIHPEYGKIVEETFQDATQIKLFLRMVQDSIDTNTSFNHYNITDTLIQIPSKVLKECLIFTNKKQVSYTEQVLSKVAV
jgi:hypothetical protein